MGALTQQQPVIIQNVFGYTVDPKKLVHRIAAAVAVQSKHTSALRYGRIKYAQTETKINQPMN